MNSIFKVEVDGEKVLVTEAPPKSYPYYHNIRGVLQQISDTGEAFISEELDIDKLIDTLRANHGK